MIPTESEEQQVVVEYCEMMNHKFTSIPNSTYTKSYNQKRKNHKEGLRAGLPDLFIIVNRHAFFIEMKRIKNSKVSDDQKSWIKAINQTEIKAYVCYGANEALKVIKYYESKNALTAEENTF